MPQKTISRRNALCYLAIFALAAFLIQMYFATNFVSWLDTSTYRDWAVDAYNNGIFGIYSQARAVPINLDYPPLYLYILYAVGGFFHLLAPWPFITPQHQMLLMKVVPVLSNIACGVLIYFICRSKSERFGLIASLLFILNPAFVFDTAFWGQTDLIMIILLLLSFWQLQNNKPLSATVLFTIACLTKFQCLIFGPIFLIQIIMMFREKRINFDQILRCIYRAVIVLVIGFVPFMIGSGSFTAPISIYFHGAGEYPYCTLAAMNLYGLFGLDMNSAHNTALTSNIAFAGISFNALSDIFLVLSIILVVFLFIKSKRMNAWFGGFILMQCVFIFITAMHDRYQISVLPFAFMMWYTTKKRGFLWVFVAISLLNFFNQMWSLCIFLNGNKFTTYVQTHFVTGLKIGSGINIAIFVISLIYCIYYLFEKSNIKSMQVRQITAT